MCLMAAGAGAALVAGVVDSVVAAYRNAGHQLILCGRLAGAFWVLRLDQTRRES